MLMTKHLPYFVETNAYNMLLRKFLDEKFFVKDFFPEIMIFSHSLAKKLEEFKIYISNRC